MNGVDRWLTSVSLNGQDPAWTSAVVMVVAGLALIALATFFRGRHHPSPSTAPTAVRAWLRVLVCLLVAAAVTVLAKLLVEDVWKPFPDAIPFATWALVFCPIAAIGVAVPAIGRRRGRGRGRRVLRVLATVACVVMMLLGTLTQINLQYSAFPNLGAVFGIDGFVSEPSEQALAPRARTVAAAPGQTVESIVPADWTTPDGERPSNGVVTQVPIPGTLSGFPARPAEIYLPPVYQADPRPELPVVVAMAGEPGEPEDWTTSVQMPQVMDQYAAQHNGVAPIVVVVDPIAERLGNTLCVDSPRGNADTYLARDVPAWIDANLQATKDTSRWAISGFSFGGTCAVQLALAHPDLYPTFLAMSPQDEPTIGTRQETVDAFFGGDAAAFSRHNPLDILAAGRYPNLHGGFAVGTKDSEYRPATEKLAAAAKAAGVDTTLEEVPGGHNFSLWQQSLKEFMPWLAQKLTLA